MEEYRDAGSLKGVYKMEMQKACGCVGYGYVPIQQLDTIYNAKDALQQGSLFPELALTIEQYGKVCKSGGKCA